MKPHAPDRLVVVDRGRRALAALARLIFVPPLRLELRGDLPDPDHAEESPLLFLVGALSGDEAGNGLIPWMDRLYLREGAPVALILPRDGTGWSTAASHPQFCGLLPVEPEVSGGILEGLLAGARKNLARRWGQGALRRGRLSWTFTTAEAADPEQAWLLLESTLASAAGSSSDLSCLGMAFAEALTNAVEHGCLELESAVKDGPGDGLLRFLEERERRLNDPRFRNRRIQVRVDLVGRRLRVRIRNQGRGYDPRPAIPGPERAPGGHGFGLRMIQGLIDGLRVSPDGRTIDLFHRLPRRRPGGAFGAPRSAARGGADRTAA